MREFFHVHILHQSSYCYIRGETIVDVPILLDLHTNIVMVDKVFGKSSKTRFKKLETRRGTSLVECTLETGRTHQIRVHLQYLGYPIKNDRVYSSKKIFGPNLAKGGDYQFLNEKEVILRNGIKICSKTLIIRFLIRFYQLFAKTGMTTVKGKL